MRLSWTSEPTKPEDPRSVSVCSQAQLASVHQDSVASLRDPLGTERGGTERERPRLVRASTCRAVLRNWGVGPNWANPLHPLVLVPFEMPGTIPVPGNRSRLVFLKE